MAAPVFASDEEALAAATEAYAAYLTMSDQILMDGGAEPDRIRPFVSPKMAEVEIEGFTQIAEKNYRSSGGSKFENLTLQSRENGSVTAYLCSDVSTVDVWNSEGNSVVSVTRPDRTPFEVAFIGAGTGQKRLVIDSSDVWQGGGIC